MARAIHPREVGQKQVPGRHRSHSDDRLAVVPANYSAGSDPDGVLAILADGEGGGEVGGLVADLVVRAIADAYADAGPAVDAAERLVAAVREASWLVRDRAASDPDWTTARATVVAAIVGSGRVAVASVGAGRAYVVRDGHARRLTRDHSWVAERVRSGLLTESEAKAHPRRNLITRRLGDDFDVIVDVFDVALRPADSVVLCSDGLHAVVDEPALGAAVVHRGPRGAAEELVRLARERDAPDDASAIVIGPAPSAGETGGLGLPHRRSILMLASGFALVAAIAAVQLGRGSPAPAPRAEATVQVEDAADAAPTLTATTIPTTVVSTPTSRPATPTPRLPPPPPVSVVQAALGSVATPTATVTQTSTPGPSASPTAEPATATATATVIPAGSPSPTSAPKIATSTPRPPPSPTVPAPTATPAHPPPVLNPAVAGSGSIVLSWSYGGQLAADEYFDVRVWASGQSPDGIANVKQTSYAIGGSFPAGTYNWTIAVVRRASGGPIQTLVAAGETLTFTWAGAGPSGGPCPRGSNPGCG